MKYILVILILYSLFFLLCFLSTGTEKKKMANYYSYPDVIQKEIRKNKRLKTMIPPKKSTIKTFISNTIFFAIVFFLIGVLLSIHEWKNALIYFLIIGEGLNLFDVLIIDMCWWCHAKRIRIPNIGKQEDYLDMHKHVVSFIRGIPMFIFASLLAACILSVMW